MEWFQYGYSYICYEVYDSICKSPCSNEFIHLNFLTEQKAYYLFENILSISERTRARLFVENKIDSVDDPVTTKLIEHYFINSNAHHSKITLKKIWKVCRGDEEKEFKDLDYDEDRCMLLWHGTKNENIVRILDNGFRTPSSQQVVHGSMLGPGIYFADRVSKAAQYSTCTRGSYGLLFLCKVSVGSM